MVDFRVYDLTPEEFEKFDLKSTLEYRLFPKINKKKEKEKKP